MAQNAGFKFNAMFLAISTVITGCGGGGSSSIVRSSTSYTTPVLAGTVDPLVGTAQGYAITAIKSRDINADGVDEVVIGGRESQLFIDANHQDSQLDLAPEFRIS
jgi:hypothetical protein